MEGEPIIVIYCPDCLGKFEVNKSDILEGEILECELCGAEIEVMSDNPIQLRLFSDDNQF